MHADINSCTVDGTGCASRARHANTNVPHCANNKSSGITIASWQKHHIRSPMRRRSDSVKELGVCSDKPGAHEVRQLRCEWVVGLSMRNLPPRQRYRRQRRQDHPRLPKRKFTETKVTDLQMARWKGSPVQSHGTHGCWLTCKSIRECDSEATRRLNTKTLRDNHIGMRKPRWTRVQEQKQE